MYGLFFLTFHVCVCPPAPEAVNAFTLSHDYGSIFTLPSLIYFEFSLVEVFLIFPQIINQLSQRLILNLHPIPPIPHFLVSILTSFVRTTVTLHPNYFYRLPAGLPTRGTAVHTTHRVMASPAYLNPSKTFYCSQDGIQTFSYARK